MNDGMEEQIVVAEERLREAMLGSDVGVLDELLADELVFTNHLGQVLGKADDLAAHRDGVVKIRELTPSERRILVRGEAAVVSVRMHLSGSYAGTATEGDLRFTRVWARSADGAWQVIAGHSGVVT